VDERDGETDRHKSAFVLAKGLGAGRLNERNVDSVPAGSFERCDSLQGRGKEPVKSIKKVYFCIDIYNSELSFCGLDLDALIDFNDLLQTFLQCVGSLP